VALFLHGATISPNFRFSVTYTCNTCIKNPKYDWKFIESYESRFVVKKDTQLLRISFLFIISLELKS
jgi:hypothetical protein